MYNVKISEIKLENNSAIDNLIKEFQQKPTLDVYVDFHNETYYENFVKNIIYQYFESISKEIMQKYMLYYIFLDFIEKHKEYGELFKESMNNIDKKKIINELKEKFLPK